MKQKGVLGPTVHAVLSHRGRVASDRTAGQAEGGWGATIVALKHTLDEDR